MRKYLKVDIYFTLGMLKEKWIDVEKYDALESDVHSNGFNENNMQKMSILQKHLFEFKRKSSSKGYWRTCKKYFVTNWVCHFQPSCRARQKTLYRWIPKIRQNLVHSGPYSEDIKERANNLRKLYLDLPVKNGGTIIGAHNEWLCLKCLIIKRSSYYDCIRGVFMSLNKNGKLILEHEFDHFRSFMRHFYKR